MDVNYPVIPVQHRWCDRYSGAAEASTLYQIPVWTGQFLGLVIKYVKTIDSGWAKPEPRLAGPVQRILLASVGAKPSVTIVPWGESLAICGGADT